MQLYVGSQGEIDDHGDLTDEGRSAVYGVSAEAESIRGSLYGPPLVLFSSDHGPGLDSAMLVAEDIDVDEHVVSPYAESVGRYPGHVIDVHRFIGLILTRTEVETENTMVLFISHRSFVRAVAGNRYAQAMVFELPEQWQNPLFIPEFAIDLDAFARNPDRPDIQPW